MLYVLLCAMLYVPTCMCQVLTVSMDREYLTIRTKTEGMIQAEVPSDGRRMCYSVGSWAAD